MIRNRLEIIQTNHNLTADQYLQDLSATGLLIYNGKPAYQKGHEYLVSNEFNWYKTSFDTIETDSVLGFGTNSLWDIAIKNRAQLMVVADWSPWPLLTHAFILNPLLRISNSPEDFIFMISGLPGKYSSGLSLEEAFEYSKKFTLSRLTEQKTMVLELLNDLALSPLVTDMELRFLTTFFRPRLGDNLNPQNGFGPFTYLKNPNSANLTYYLEQRYSPRHIGSVPSVLSSIENFSYLKSILLNNKVYYSLSDIMDIRFYERVLKQPDLKDKNNFSLSFSNIFECGYYNHLDQEKMLELLVHLKNIFIEKNVFIYRTLGRDNPHEYLCESLF